MIAKHTLLEGPRFTSEPYGTKRTLVIDRDTDACAEADTPELAAFIVQACNAHEELVALAELAANKFGNPQYVQERAAEILAKLNTSSGGGK